MIQKSFPSGLELLVLLSIAHLGDAAYGIKIRETINDCTERNISLGAIYKTLAGLTRKGLISSKTGDPTPERGGRAKTFYQLTGHGEQALRDYERWWRGLRGNLIGETA